MFTVQNENIPLDCGFKMGLGWIIDDKVLFEKEPVYWHNGGTIAHRTAFMVAPMSKLGVVVLANSASADSDKIARKLLQTAWEAKTGEKLPLETLPVQADTASDFRGTYASLAGKVDIRLKSDHRYKVRSSLGRFNLHLEDDNQYHLSYRLLGFIPIDLEELGEARLSTADISGRHVIVAEFDHDRMLAGVRVEPQPIHGAWKNRLGAYQLLNPPEPDIFKMKKAELKIEDDFLVLAVTDNDNHTFTQILRTVKADEAISEGLGRGLGVTLRIVSDEYHEQLLTFAGLRFKRIEG
jgi:hypothetical protein